jgi:hypothetical protein
VKTPPGYENIGVGLLKDSTLMGMFPIPPPDVPPPLVASINMISTLVRQTHPSSNPWIIPELGDYIHYGDQMPLSLVESTYHAIQLETPFTPSLGDSSPDPFHVFFPTDEMIMSIISMEDTPWDDGHHRSILFVKKNTIESYQWISTPSTIVVISSVPKTSNDMLYEGNLSNISPTIPLNISIKPGVVENFQIGASCSTDEVITYKSLFQDFCDIFAWSYEEMSGIDPDIVLHEIKTYSGARPIRQRLRPIHPCKAATIKLEVEKILKPGFIYPVALTDWVSNLVLVNKKQGTIHFCVDYRDINQARYKDNFPTPFVDQIVDDCVESEIFSLMDGFSSYNQINILPVDQHKTAFQHAMYNYFHDIKHIVQPYLDNLLAHSIHRSDHLTHLRAIFLHCRFYRICLNPHKCVFCVEFGRLLGFIVSRQGIRVVPLKVEVILNLPPPSSLCQLQSLQGKANFLGRFIPNYAQLMLRFT